MFSKVAAILDQIKIFIHRLSFFAPLFVVFFAFTLFCAESSFLAKEPSNILSSQKETTVPSGNPPPPSPQAHYEAVPLSSVLQTAPLKIELISPDGVKIFNTSLACAQDIVSEHYENYDPERDLILYPAPSDKLLDPSIALHSISVVSLPKISSEIIHEEEALPFETVYQKDSLLLEGQQAVLSKGHEGVLKTSYEVFYKDDEEIGRILLSEERTEPKNKVVVVGQSAPQGGVLHVDGEDLSYSNVYEMKAYAYCLGGRTATGTTPKRGSVAVDPKVIPLGSKLYVVASDGTSWCYGYAVAEDTGGAIKGSKIDLYMETNELCIQFGVKSAKVYILN